VFHSSRVAARAAVLTALALGGLSMLGVASASAATLGTVGTSTPTNPQSNQAVLSGGSQVQFTVALTQSPATPPAHCRGDTANGGYHVYSYLVKQANFPADLTSLSFVNFPSGFGTTAFGYFDATGTYYGPANTAITTGQIINVPFNLTWDGLAQAAGGGSSANAILLYNGGTSGVWEAGIVCADTTGAVTDYWNNEITFTASSSDPDGFTWTDVPTLPNPTPEVAWAVLLPVAAVAAFGGSVLFLRRRHHHQTAAAERSLTP
jgi:hypothetical protein